MTEVLRVGNQVITPEEIIPRLVSYQMLPQLLCEMIIDQAIAPIECKPEDTASACQQFCQEHRLTSESERQAWLDTYGMTSEQLVTLATRKLRIERFKQATWNHQVEAYFLNRKRQLDKVVYSLLRTKDPSIAQELYFRIQEEEQSFAELAKEYSQGPEAQTGGLFGPVELSQPHPTLARMLALSQPGQLWAPTRLEEWFVIIRLEKFIPAQLDETTRRRLLQELFTSWLQAQLKQIGSLHRPSTMMSQ